MGRPQKSEQDKRTDPPIKIKMNSEERAIAKRESEHVGLSMVAWARRKLFGSVPDQRRANPFRAKLITALNDIGHIKYYMKTQNVPREVIDKFEAVADNLLKMLGDGHTR